MGTDTYQDLKMGKWRNSEELLQIVNMVVVDRECVRTSLILYFYVVNMAIRDYL